MFLRRNSTKVKRFSIAALISALTITLVATPTNAAGPKVEYYSPGVGVLGSPTPKCGETFKIVISGLNAGTYNVGFVFTEIWNDGTRHDLVPPSGVNRASKLGEITVTDPSVDSFSSDLIWGWGSDKGAAVTAGSFEEMMPCIYPTALYVDRGSDPLPVNSQVTEAISVQVKSSWQRGGSFSISGSGYQSSFGGLGTFYKGRTFTVTDDNYNWGLPETGASNFSGIFKAYAIAQPDSNSSSFWKEWFANNGANKQLMFGGSINNGRLTVNEYAANLSAINTDVNEKISVLTYFYGSGSAGKDAGWYVYEYTTVTYPPGGGGVSAPGTPGTPTVAAADGSATITVSDSGTGGIPDSYTVTANPGGQTCTVTGASGSCTISGLTNGTSYTFTATATNSGGTSSSSSASTAVTPTSANSGGGNTSPAAPANSNTSSSTTSSKLAAGELGELAATPPTSSPAQGTSTTTIGGSSVGTTTRASDATDSVTSSNGGRYSSSVTFKDIDDSQTVPLTTNKTIGIEPGSELSVTGRGFKGNSQVQVYLIDAKGNSTYLGAIGTNIFGRVNGRLPVPTSVTLGNYTLQLNGFTRVRNLVRSSNLGVEVVQDDFGSLYFDSDSAVATDQTIATVKEMAKSIDPGETVILYGYTSGNPDSKYRAANLRLATQRTSTIRDLFAVEGVKSTIIIQPKGAVFPYVSNGSAAQNRRVDVRPEG